MPDRCNRIYLGIDDTDMPGTPGTNHLVRQFALTYTDTNIDLVLRHQLLLDPQIPFTSGNGCASAILCDTSVPVTVLSNRMREWLSRLCPRGSDPAFAIAVHIPPEVVAFAQRCQTTVVQPEDARRLAQSAGVHLETVHGTPAGTVGALAALGLVSTGNDGRVVHRRGWPWPDPFGGVQGWDAVLDRGVGRIEPVDGTNPSPGPIDVGKRLRPAMRNGEVVLFVEQASATATHGARWQAVKRP